MKRLLLPVLLALAGLGGGVAAGLALRPPPPDPAAAETDGKAAPTGAETENGAEDGSATAGKAGKADHSADGAHGAPAEAPPVHPADAGKDDMPVEFVRLNNQFIVPIVAEGKVAALVVMAISLEVTAGQREAVFAMEPRLRDGFLAVLFDHANAGGFDGTFTTSENLYVLRRALLESARSLAGPGVRDVLITDLVRQDN